MGKWVSGLRRIPLLTTILLALNVAIFLVEDRFGLREFGALSVQGIRAGHYWELLTFQFLHANWVHLALNCWGIFLFGPPVETSLGARRLAWLYLVSGVMGGLLQVIATLLTGKHFSADVVGASAGVFGLVAAFTMLFPDERMTLLLFFIIPVRMTAHRMLTLAAVVTVLGMIYPHWLLGRNVAHAAHLGGLIGGLAMVRLFLWRFRR